jgi:hypothetical protein
MPSKSRFKELDLELELELELKLQLVLSRYLWERGEKGGASLQSIFKGHRSFCTSLPHGRVRAHRCCISYLHSNGESSWECGGNAGLEVGKDLDHGTRPSALL